MAKGPFPGILRPKDLVAWCPQVGRWQWGWAGYLCPSSWATVKARGRPVSSLMLQLRCGWHMPATWDRPRVSQGQFVDAHRSFLHTRREVALG